MATFGICLKKNGRKEDAFTSHDWTRFAKPNWSHKSVESGKQNPCFLRTSIFEKYRMCISRYNLSVKIWLRQIHKLVHPVQPVSDSFFNPPWFGYLWDLWSIQDTIAAVHHAAHLCSVRALLVRIKKEFRRKMGAHASGAHWSPRRRAITVSLQTPGSLNVILILTGRLLQDVSISFS